MRSNAGLRATLHTELGPDECLRRLGASGWAGERAPGKWRPVPTDRGLFRRLAGQTIHLLPRESATGELGHAATFVPRFIGTISPHGVGARIDCRYGTQLAKPLIALGVAILAGTLLAASTERERYGTALSVLQLLVPVGLVYLLLVFAFVFLGQIATRTSDETMARAIRFLEETLDAQGTVTGSESGGVEETGVERRRSTDDGPRPD